MTSQAAWSPVAARGPFLGFADAAGSAVRQLNRQVPGMDLWLVTCVIDDRQLVVASAGRWVDLAPTGREFLWRASFCIRMVTGQAPPVAPDVASSAYRPVAVGPLAKVRAYLGVPLQLAETELFGTLCALGGTPQPDTLHEAMPSVALLGRLLSTVLAGERATRDRSVEAARAYALADRDPLTGLSNRRGFEAAVRVEQGRGHRFSTTSSILVLAPEPSAPGPDDIARRCAEVLTELSQPGDVVARIDGGDFALLAVAADAVGARALQVRARQALRSIGVRARVGTATQRRGEELTQTWARARQAMPVEARRLGLVAASEPSWNPAG